MSRGARWRLVDEHGRQVDPGHVPEPWGSQEQAAEFLAWLLGLDAAEVAKRLVRVDLPAPALAKAANNLNALAVRIGVSRGRKETA